MLLPRSLEVAGVWCAVFGLRCVGTEGVGTGVHGFFLGWQNHRSTVPRMGAQDEHRPRSLVAEDDGATGGPSDFGYGPRVRKGLQKL